MAVGVMLFRFEKMENSTANPASAGIEPQVVMPCFLKEPCSVRTPVLTLRFDNDSPYPGHSNYAYIQQFGRYYHIMDWVCVSNTVWEAHLKVDVCGSYRNDILRSTQFVERAEKSSDGTIPDKLGIATGFKQITTPWTGRGMVLAMGGNGTSYYTIDEGHLISLLNYMFGDGYVDDAVPGWSEVYPEIKAQANPLQFVQSLRLFPFDVSEYATGRDSIRVGFVSSPVSAGTLSPGFGAKVTFLGDTFEVPAHPQQSSLPYTRLSPYSEIGVWYPPFGDISLDPEVVAANGNEVLTEVSVDLISGNAVLECRSGGCLLGSAEAKVGIDVAISQTYRTGYGAANLIGSAAGIASAAALGNWAGALSGFASTLENIAGSKTPKLRMTGSNGGSASLDPTGYTYGRFQKVIPPAAHFAGRPLYQTVTLNTLLGGFCLCRNPEMEQVGTVQETLDLERIMGEGFYLE